MYVDKIIPCKALPIFFHNLTRLGIEQGQKWFEVCVNVVNTINSLYLFKPECAVCLPISVFNWC